MNTPGISREFSTGELLRFAAPSIVMMLFLSMYTIVDGFFISRYVGTAALSATNIVYPLIGFFLAVTLFLYFLPSPPKRLSSVLNTTLYLPSSTPIL